MPLRYLNQKAPKSFTEPAPNRPWLLRFSEKEAVCLLDRKHIMHGALKLPRNDKARYCVYDLDEDTFGEYRFFTSLKEATKKFDAIANGTSFSVHT